MQIVIPMSGFGERFQRAGYTVPKPLIEIDGRPMIEHVVNLFPGEIDFFFICNREHLEDRKLKLGKLLKDLCPSCTVVGIEPHKLGPVHAVLQIAHLLKTDAPVIVNYCDFACYWNWNDFKQFVSDTCCDGAVPAYKGFHPHSLGSTNYAYLRTDGPRVIDIQEKKPFTANKMNEYASSGTYYFSSGNLMNDAMRYVLERNLSIAGEYYVSLCFRYFLSRGMSVEVYSLQHFMQWGTPEDLEEYTYWSRIFSSLGNPSKRPNIESRGALVMPMAGQGARFLERGYDLPKPLIPVSGFPMVIQALKDLPAPEKVSLVVRRDMQGYEEISDLVSQLFDDLLISDLPALSGGQACSASIGIKSLGDLESTNTSNCSLTIGACDNGIIFDQGAFLELLNRPEVDVVVWATKGHFKARRNPQMFGWINADANGRIKRVSVKQPLKSPASDPMIIGTFTFKRSLDFLSCYDNMIFRGGKVNGEYYLDELINDAIALGLNCYLFEIDHYISWGTPDEYETFRYWQSCFHKWQYHPYSIDSDQRVNADMIEELRSSFYEQGDNGRQY